MKKKLKYLITGGTGFLGQTVLRSLEKEAEVDVLSRSGKTGIKGDLSRWMGGLDIEKIKEKQYDVFIHLAGLYDLAANESDVYMNNVAGTNVALQIAGALKIPVFINASSIAAAANQTTDSVSPYDLEFINPFPDPYSESKAFGEQLVKNHLGFIPKRINLRLGVLVGDSEEGRIMRIDGPYEVVEKLRKMKSLLLNWPFALPVPGNPTVRIPFVPVNQAAQAIVDISKLALESEKTGYSSYNLVPKNGVTVEDLYQSIFRHVGVGSMKLVFVNQVPKTIMTKLGSLALSLPEEQLRYALGLPKYESDSTRELLGENWCSEFADYESTFWRGYEKFISNR